ncbi:hypothetical protein QBC42DRAFT_227770 [Cladorrhinum samala]|uniref:Zn(2)-C6 fungal-type domain-containing protein n=1 Tax=Cladorrhinum samala TaxID=585594 RepID=A0AAV9HMH1_9PEZI|nr:hypothetical protein QBC42DRAFT_227770 [Cladorrhinum samala]
MPHEHQYPPMPRRQSCDRCHEQKVRCVTPGQDGSGLGPVAEEDEATLGMQVVAEIPCVRCRKAGALCIFSPQLRSGRPRIHKPPTHASSRKRRSRQGPSRCASSSPSTSPAVSQSSSPRSMPPNFAPGNIDPSLAHSVAGSPANLSQFDPREHDFEDPHGLHQEHQWVLGAFESDNAQYLGNNLCHPPPFTQLPEAYPLSGSPFFIGHTSGAASSTETVLTDYSWAIPSLPEPENNTFPEEISQMNLRIHRAAQGLCPLVVTSLSLSTPAVNEVFDASCAFINIVDRYVARRTQSVSQSHMQINGIQEEKSRNGSDAIHIATETSMIMSIVACHQLILGAFEFLCASFTAELTGIQMSMPTTSRMQQSGGPLQNTQQILAMMNLISHLLNQLSQSVSSLASAGQDSPAGYLCGHEKEAGTGSVISIVLGQSEQRLLNVSGQVQALQRLLKQ